MANILGYVGIGVSGLVLLFSILAIALNNWSKGEIGTTKIEAGLWEICLETQGTTTCSDIEDSNISDDDLTNYRAVRAMVMLGILLSTGAIVAGVLVMFVLKSTKLLFFVAAGLDIAAGLFLMIGMAIYVAEIADDNYDLHVAFAMDIMAWIGAWAAGGIFVGANVMDKE